MNWASSFWQVEFLQLGHFTVMEIIYCPVAMMYPLLMYSACACAFRIAASSVSGTLSTTKSGNMTVSTGNNVAYSIIATPSLPRASRWQTKDITPTSSSTIHSTSKQQLNSTLTVILSPSVVMDQCLNCNGTTKESDRYFLFTMLGIGIGSTLFIFIVLLLVVICRRLVKQRISDRENELAYVRDGEDFLRSKESIFSSSTLQLHGGVSNDGLELDCKFFSLPFIIINGTISIIILIIVIMHHYHHSHHHFHPNHHSHHS